MAIRAKFQVSTVTRVDYGRGSESEKVEMFPVCSSEPESENAQWYKATPVGKIEMTIDNPGAHGQLQAGKEYYIDFTPAE